MKMKRKQKRWLALGMAALLVTGQADFSLAAALKNQMVQSGEGEIVGLVPAESELVQDNASYHVSVDLNAGGAFSVKMPDKSNDWNTLGTDMVPGTTMLSGQAAAVSTKNMLSAKSGDSVSGGIEIDGDISGYKSYFMFDEEIMFLGVGLTNESGLPGSELWTVVDTVPVKTAGSPRNKIALTGSQSAGIGYRWAEAMKQKDIAGFM